MQGNCQLIFEIYAGRRIFPVVDATIEIIQKDSTEKNILTTNMSGKVETTVDCTKIYTANINAVGFIPVLVTGIHLGNCKRAVVATMLYPTCAQHRNTTLTQHCRTCNICSLNDEEILELWQQDTTHLKLGSRSSAVRITENRLNRIHKYYPIVPLIMSVDNYFTKETAAAILAFQRTFDLAANGVLDKVTYTTIAELAESINLAEELRADAHPLPKNTPDVNLKMEDQGENVLQLQYLLQVANIFYNLPQQAIDGVFGEATATAVLAFQQFFLLPETGVVSSADWEVLYDMFLGVCSIYPFVVQASDDVLTTNDTGYSVTLLQIYLNAIANRYATLPCAVTGTFDKETALAVTAFRVYFGLTQNAAVDYELWQKLFRVRLLL